MYIFLHRFVPPLSLSLSPPNFMYAMEIHNIGDSI